MKHVLMCQSQFVPKILSGEKPHTIRGLRKRVIHAGDILSLREWTGKPYRSKQRLLKEVVCTRVQEIRMKETNIWHIQLGGHVLYVEEAEALARADGFVDLESFWNFFKLRLPFVGNLIEWK